MSTRLYTAVQTGLVLIGLLIIIGLIYLLILLSLKLLGIVLALAGLWLLIYFPWYGEYQPETFTNTARAAGLVLIALGIVLVIYG